MSILLFIGLVFTACNSRNKSENSGTPLPAPILTSPEKISKITSAQEKGLDALNALQVNIEGEHLYSTFPGLSHTFLPEDSSFTITDMELLQAINSISKNYGGDLSAEKFDKLAKEAIQLQDLYHIKECTRTIYQPINHSIKSLPGKDTISKIWLIQNLLNRRDLIIIF